MLDSARSGARWLPIARGGSDSFETARRNPHVDLRTIAALLDRAFDLSRQQARLLSGWYIAPLLPLSVFQAGLFRWAEDQGGVEPFLVVLSLTLYSFVVALPSYFVTWRIWRLLSGETSTVKAGLQESFRSLPRILWTTLLVVVVMVVACIALVAPVFLAMSALFLVYPVMCIERSFGLAAMKRSLALMKGRKRYVLLVIGAWIIASGGLGAVAELLPTSDLVRDVFSATVTLLLEVYFLVFAIVLYVEIRTHDEALDLEMLATQIDSEQGGQPI